MGHGGKKQPAMATFEATRPAVAAQALGIAHAAYEFALDYAKERTAFGKPIIMNQASRSSWPTWPSRSMPPACCLAGGLAGPQRRLQERRGLDEQAARPGEVAVG